MIDLGQGWPAYYIPLPTDEGHKGHLCGDNRQVHNASCMEAKHEY